MTKTEVKSNVVFIVVDGSTSKPYPLNFVCRLPRLQRQNLKDSDFSLKFGDQCQDLAKKLLTESLGQESDPEILGAIQLRLKEFDQKR